jgi:GH35 family endo-1,4-beta-xylanase
MTVKIVSLALALIVASTGCSRAQVQKDVPALKDVFAGHFSIGCILSYRHIGLPGDPPVPGSSPVVAPLGGELVKYHMNSMSPGNNMKAVYTVDVAASAAACASASAEQARRYAETHPVVRFNGDLVAQLDWAKRNGFKFRGHTLVWHSQTPAELFRVGYAASAARVDAATMAERMDNYIGEVIRLLHERWPGLLAAMDVVNEAVDDGGRVRKSGNEWYQVFKDESYVMKAFESARKYAMKYGETGMKLYYNDYNTSFASKADGIVKLCKPIYEAGFLDGIGMQEHDDLHSPDAKSWIASYDKFYPICSEMSVTELDVAAGSPKPSSEVLKKQADRYAALFTCFVERSAGSGRGKIVNVTKDGLNDEFTFKTNQSSSLWGADYKCKPAFYAVVETAKAVR